MKKGNTVVTFGTKNRALEQGTTASLLSTCVEGKRPREPATFLDEKRSYLARAFKYRGGGGASMSIYHGKRRRFES